MQHETRTYQIVTTKNRVDYIDAHGYRRDATQVVFVDADDQVIAAYDRADWFSFHEIADAGCVAVTYNAPR